MSISLPLTVAVDSGSFDGFSDSITDDVFPVLPATQLTTKRVLDGIHPLPISRSHPGVCHYSGSYRDPNRLRCSQTTGKMNALRLRRNFG